MNINNTEDLRTVLRSWYQSNYCHFTYFVMSDGESMSHKALLENYRLVIRALRDKDTRSGWMPVGVDVNYEDDMLLCCHRGAIIPAAYVE